MSSALKVIDAPDRGSAGLVLELPDSTSFDEWVSIGRRLCLWSQGLNWQIGDWWAFGDHRYGARAKAVAEGIFGLEYGTLANMASVCRRFEPSRRRETLTFRHHTEVASLQPSEADVLLEKAERDHLSANLLRREVQAIKAANDPDEADREHEPPPSKAVPPHSDRAELATAYQTVIEFAEALQQLRPLTRRESDLLSAAFAFVEEAHAGHRPCPEDFDVIFVEQGRLACEAWYRASRLTINRWLIERGKRRLIDERSAFVRHQRDQEPRQKPPEQMIEDDEELLPVAREAAHFLRASRYGGWVISKAPAGGWLVGTVRKTGEELIAMAERQGFDRYSVEEHF